MSVKEGIRTQGSCEELFVERTIQEQSLDEGISVGRYQSIMVLTPNLDLVSGEKIVILGDSDHHPPCVGVVLHCQVKNFALPPVGEMWTLIKNSPPCSLSFFCSVSYLFLFTRVLWP